MAVRLYYMQVIGPYRGQATHCQNRGCRKKFRRGQYIKVTARGVYCNGKCELGHRGRLAFGAIGIFLSGKTRRRNRKT